MPRRFRRGANLIEQHWEGESTAVVRDCDAGRTHLLSSDSLALLRSMDPAVARSLREIAHAAGLEGELEEALGSNLQGIIEGLMQVGLVLECPDGATGSRPPP